MIDNALTADGDPRMTTTKEAGMTFRTFKPYVASLCICVGSVLLLLSGCASRALQIPSQESSQAIKAYRNFTMAADRPPWTGSRVTVGRDDIAVVMAFGKVTTWAKNRSTTNVPPERFLYARVGDNEPFQMRTNPMVAEVEEAGELRFAVRDWRNIDDIKSNWYRDNSGGYRVHIFVVPRHRWKDFENLLTDIADANPADHEATRQIRKILGPRAGKISGMDYAEIMTAWLKTRTFEGRRRIIQELGRRKEAQGLTYCYEYVLNGYFYNPWYWRTAISEDLMLLPEIYAAYPEGQTLDIRRLVDLLEDSNPEIRSMVLEVMAEMKPKNHTAAVYPLLFDKDYRMRIKALNTLIAIHNPESANRISLLLIDRNKAVRQRAEAALRTLGVPTDTIEAWRAKAQQLNMDSYFESWRDYNRTVSEKKVLEKKLATSEATKGELEAALRNRDSVQKTQQDLKGSLYEKERELQSQKTQLEMARQELDRYRKRGADDRSTGTESAFQGETVLQERIEALDQSVVTATREAENVKLRLAETQLREQDLVRQIDSLKGQLDRGSAPIIAVLTPQGGARVKTSDLLLHMVAVDDKGVQKVDILLDGRPIELSGQRGLRLTGEENRLSPKRNIKQKLKVGEGPHELVITAEDSDGLKTTETLQFTCIKERGTIWSAVIGINDYQSARDLKYAVNDARGFAAYLTDQVGVPRDHVFLLTDAAASKTKIESLLGTQLKRAASEDDSVIIFYAGHGAVETDPSNPDGDGFEKYLLPYDAQLDDLYASSISMNDIRTIFGRIRAKRLIFISDTCYSGSAGGRTLLTAKSRANLSDRFMDRISHGKGRVIISSCSANEVSKEDDALGHGIFSYYLLEGLRGKADQDGDGIITVDELFAFLSRTVPGASGQDQHPVKKGEMEGELVIGRSQ